MKERVFLFGEAEKGSFCTPLVCRTLTQLVETLGQAPNGSLGIYYAVQTLLTNRELIFFRVEEEGFSHRDYIKGCNLLETKKKIKNLAAIGMPGVGDRKIIERITPICKQTKSVLLINESDLYDYLTEETSLG